ncbi:hypothetical protein GCM10027034_41880 [Ramlibacter solisilvae]
MTQETGAIKAQSTAGVGPRRAFATRREPVSWVTLRAGGWQAAWRRCDLAVCASTRPRPRLALQPASYRREPSYSVNRP